MGMVGLRDLFLVAPAYHHHQRDAAGAISGPNAAADHQINGTAATALGVGVIPLLTAGPCLATAAAPPPPQNVEETDLNFLSSNSRNNKLAGIQLWQNQPQSQTQYLHFKNQPTVISPMNLMQTGVGPSAAAAAATTGVGSNSNSASGTATCQDCGNQAKKECSHKRCRTCCKSRGFACPTHVKSTWVPAARRRERQLMVVGAGSSVSTSGTKKPRLIGSQQQQQTQRQQQTTSHTSTSNTTPPQSFDTSSSHQEGGVREGWPGQIRAPAVFKCVRVTALEDGEDEYAYQAVVKIGGHVFKGFLYDQGVEPKEGIPNISELHLGGGGNNNGNVNNNGATSSSPILEPDVYGTGAGGGGGFLGGSCYG